MRISDWTSDVCSSDLAEPRTPSGPVNEHGTTHYVAVDRAGNVASMTSTVESVFGSQLVANGYVLNNELADFTFAPEKGGKPVANQIGRAASRGRVWK